jgi:hypothetical protein
MMKKENWVSFWYMNVVYENNNVCYQLFRLLDILFTELHAYSFPFVKLFSPLRFPKTFIAELAIIIRNFDAQGKEQQ